MLKNIKRTLCRVVLKKEFLAGLGFRIVFEILFSSNAAHQTAYATRSQTAIKGRNRQTTLDAEVSSVTTNILAYLPASHWATMFVCETQNQNFGTSLRLGQHRAI